MPPTIEVDIKDILTQINQKLDTIGRDVVDLKVGQARLEEKQVRLEENQARLEEKMSSLENRLEEKLSSLENRLEEKILTVQSLLEQRLSSVDKRLDNQEFLNRTVVAALMGALLIGLAKMFGFIGNP